MSFVGRRSTLSVVIFCQTLWVAAIMGCASPGSPRPPSLGLPRPVRDLSALRVGGTVEVRFTTPTTTTDGQALRPGPLYGNLCRQVRDGPCRAVDEAQTRNPFQAPAPGSDDGQEVLWTDELPAELTTGAPLVILYRVEFRNSAGRSAGWSDPAYTGAGAAPPAVVNLAGQGTRRGVLLQWSSAPEAGEVLLERKQLSEGPGEAPGKGSKHAGLNSVTWLQAEPGNKSLDRTIDNSATEGVSFSYVALRRTLARVGGRTVEVRSGPSAPVRVMWRDVYPPAVPQGMTAVGFSVPATQARAAGYAVDLVWEPVNDARLAGYLVYRQRLNAAGEPEEARQRLTASPVTAPAFHDASAIATGRYRYGVTAIDPKGNESAPATAEVGP